jgi:hypothetical protein
VQNILPILQIPADHLKPVQPIHGEHRENREIWQKDGVIEKDQVMKSLEGIIEERIDALGHRSGKTAGQKERGNRYAGQHEWELRSPLLIRSDANYLNYTPFGHSDVILKQPERKYICDFF